MRFSSLSVLTCLVLGCGETITAPPLTNRPDTRVSAGPIRIALLGEHEEIHAKLHAYGCFSDDSLTFVFRTASTGDSFGAPGQSVRIAISSRNAIEAIAQASTLPLSRSPGRTAVRIRALDATELHLLDAFVDTYREPPRGICTSQSDLELSLYRRGSLVQRETLHLSSCNFDNPTPVTFFTLAYGP